MVLKRKKASVNKKVVLDVVNKVATQNGMTRVSENKWELKKK
jgi:hypothetical protein